MTGRAPLVIAIDGPAGSGKSTIAAALARRLGLPHVDTGAYYRAATLAVLRAGVDVTDADRVTATVRRARIDRYAGRVVLDGQDVEDEIRGPAVTAAVSTVSAHPPLRYHLVELQRAEVGAAGGVVEGRDAGTVVVPDAPLKVWLTASPAERAARRAAQLGPADSDAVALHAAQIAERDASDAARMVRADGVVEVDTSGRSVEQVVAELVEHAIAASAARGGGG
ncbi:MAG: (d)CMP kinase [Euzebyales bacterium]|nr:(d)CMP kinase [Euzebyales bacterium]